MKTALDFADGALQLFKDVPITLQQEAFNLFTFKVNQDSDCAEIPQIDDNMYNDGWNDALGEAKDAVDSILGK